MRREGGKVKFEKERRVRWGLVDSGLPEASEYKVTRGTRILRFFFSGRFHERRTITVIKALSRLFLGLFLFHLVSGLSSGLSGRLKA